MSFRFWIIGVAALSGLCALHASGSDLIVASDGAALEGKVVSQTDHEIDFLADGVDPSSVPIHFNPARVRLVKTDEHGGAVTNGPTTQPAKWTLPDDPEAPPIVEIPKNQSTYYVIPLHGEVGETVLGAALEKSLADALKRKPTVVVLDIDSPGGSVEEARKIIDILHHYNKKLRMVAWAGQDLSAAAILSLSVREIYVKPACTFGAATSYIPGNLVLPPKLEEKMQSAWRAVARNSAEEGKHEALLAEAMIDNDMALHVETVDGKPAVKEGEGDHLLCRKGKILTLTSHEAVDCGLAAGEADDLDELGTNLKLDKWTECKGLGRLLAESLPKRSEAFQREMEQIDVHLRTSLAAAANSDPSASQVTSVTQMVPTRQPSVQPNFPRPPVPGRPGVPGGLTRTQTVTVTHRSPAQWKPASLACVVHLQDAEACIADGIALCEAYGRSGDGEILKGALDRISAVRAGVFDDRNKYGEGGNAIATVPPAISRTNPAGLPDGAERTEQFGSRLGAPFSTVGRAGGPVVGFRYVVGDWNGKPVVQSFSPLYAGFKTDTSGKTNEVVPKEGYAISSLEICNDRTCVLGIQLTFARVRDGHQDTTDTYKSDWIGKQDESDTHVLGGHGETILGIFGRRGMNLDSIGLIVSKPKDSGK